MRIFFLTHEFPPVGGGAGKIIKNIALNFAKSGHEVHILTSRYKNFQINVTHFNLHFHYVWGKRKSALENSIFPTFISFFFLGFLKSLWIIRKYKIYIIHSSISLPCGLIGIILSKIFRKAHILSLSGSDIPYHTRSRLMIILKPLIKIILLNCDLVIANSKGLVNTLKKTADINEIKVKVIYPGVNFPKKNHFVKSNTVPNEPINLISIGRLIKIKGFQDVILSINEIIKESQIQINYSIVGDGPYMKNLKELIKKFNLGEHVKLHGFINDKNEKSKLFFGSDIFIGASHYEALGLVFIEALAHGLPLIGTNTGGIPEIISSDDYGILVEPRNIADIKDAIIKLSKNLNYFDKTVLMNKSKDFSWQKVSNDYLNCYAKVLSKYE